MRTDRPNALSWFLVIPLVVALFGAAVAGLLDIGARRKRLSGDT